MRPDIHIIHACAPNDTNGNPRRAFIVLNGTEQGHTVYDEGYEGEGAIPEYDRKNAATWTTLKVTPGQYRDLIRPRSYARS